MALAVPAQERRWFDDVASYWESPKARWHIYDVHPHHQMLAESVGVDRAMGDGDEIRWGDARVKAISTPGHTDGSMTYIIEADACTVAFTGGLIYDGGRVEELYSLQARFPITTDYHGFMGTRDECMQSLREALAHRPSTLVPSSGPIIDEPEKAVGALAGRLEECYAHYASISALRWYFPQLFADAPAGERAVPLMPPSPPMDPPPWVQHVSTSWILLSESGAAFVMDCAGKDVVEHLQDQVVRGSISAIEGLWITHYHDDHVDGVPAFQSAFNCPLIAVDAVAEVIAAPLDWRLPCISPGVSRVDWRPGDGESWTWREFRLTAYAFPGQSLHHGGLMVEGRGRRLFFSGDSVTPSGIDDYCVGNRNFLGADVGYGKCLRVLEDSNPDAIFNAHVDVAFRFSADQYAFMRQNLACRERLFGDLLPWPDANFGLDDAWAYCHPYEQIVHGNALAVTLVVTNHSPSAEEVTACICLPSRLGGSHSRSVRVTVAAKGVQRVRLEAEVPGDAAPGRHVVTVDVALGDCVLRQHAEAIVITE